MSPSREVIVYGEDEVVEVEYPVVYEEPPNCEKKPGPRDTRFARLQEFFRRLVRA